MGIFYSRKAILSDIIELTFDGAIVINTSGEIVMLNSQIRNIFGYSLDDKLEGKNIDIFIPDPFKEAHKDYINNINFEKANYMMGKNRYIYAKKKDGSVIPVYIKLKSIKYIYSNHILALIHDRTDEKMIKDDIYQYKLLFDSSIDLLCIAKNGYFFKVNKAFTNLLGYSEAELYSKPYTEFVHPDDANKTNTETFQLLNGINCVSFENRYITKTGKVIWLSWNGYPIEGVVYASARDITAKKEFEQELLDAKDIAQKESKIKSTFVANISHEIRTPINAIIGMTSLLETTELNKEQSEYLATIIKSSGVLLSIINNVLDISKIESGKMSLDILTINIIDLLTNIEKYYADLIIKNNIKFNLFINNNVPQLIKGDSVKLQQIITNLLNNSIKFTEKGYIYLIVYLENGYIKFQVKDTGIGISEEYQKKLFQPFQQANNTTTREYGGTGLGLSICKNLVNLMNGNIYLKSTVNFGTTITFEIPYIRPNETSKSENTIDFSDYKRISSSENRRRSIHRENKSKSLDETRPLFKNILSRRNSLSTILNIRTKENNSDDLLSGESISTSSDESTPGQILKVNSFKSSLCDPNPTHLSKIIIVEDHKINQMVITKLLEKLNFRNYVVFNNGKECVDSILTQANILVVFMDLHMPIMDGYNCTKCIRDMGIDVPIVALTANAMSGEKDKCISIGMNEFLLKPIQLKILESVLNKYLSM